MPRYKGAHLTWNDRLTIEKMLREGYSKPQIARYLGVHHSTVYDECRRGAVELKRSDLTTYISYSADVAKDYHLDRKKNMEKPLKKCGLLSMFGIKIGTNRVVIMQSIV